MLFLPAHQQRNRFKAFVGALTLLLASSADFAQAQPYSGLIHVDKFYTNFQILQGQEFKASVWAGCSDGGFSDSVTETVTLSPGDPIAGATTTLVPNSISSSNGNTPIDSIFKVQTTTSTLPGVYQLSVGGQGATCGSYIPFTTQLIVGPGPDLSLIDPFLIPPGKLTHLGLATFLASNPNLPSYSANGMIIDGASAAIALFQTYSLSPVKLKVSGPATLLPYSDSFLTRPPTTGQADLTVRKLIYAGGGYYAAALIQGSLTGYSAGPIVVTAEQDNQKQSVTMYVLPPPVVLVHGLWGDANSLANVQNYLQSTAPWSSTYVTPVCYSQYLRFDAGNDPLASADNPCEVTSVDALQTAITSILALADMYGIVGARVDVVAHSMGGLVVRNFAQQRKYASTRNRMLGQFYNIVTLDTPETGSALASFLIKNRSSAITSGSLWPTICPGETLEGCLGSVGMPLAASTLPASTGVVQSLEPNSPSLVNIAGTGPNIANANWRAISAIGPSNGTLEALLNSLIASLDRKNPNPTTVNHILGGSDNDAIVTLQSQTNGAGAGQSVTYPDLSHTTVVSSLLSYFPTENDDSVLDDSSGQVNYAIGCWLLSPTSSFCTSPPGHKRPVKERKSVWSAAAGLEDRISLRFPASITLGAPFDIAMEIPPAADLTGVTVFQRTDDETAPLEEIKPVVDSGNRLHIRVTPRLLGDVTFGVTARFADDVESVKKTYARVAPPAAPPYEFEANILPVLAFDLETGPRSAWARPYAVYTHSIGRVWLSARYVKYRILSQSSPATIRIDSNGLINALKPGTATVEARYGSAVSHLKVVVHDVSN